MNEGRLDRREIRCWVANRFAYQAAIPRKDAAILANCPDREVRRRWIRRIHDHDGTADGEGGIEAGGIEAWLRLGEAVGLRREEMEDQRHVVPGVRFAVDAYVTFARTRPWVEAVASSLTELFAPDLMAERLAAFERHYTWIDPRGLAYFRARLTQAPRDAEHALEVVTRALPDTRRAGGGRGGAGVQVRRPWWAILDRRRPGRCRWTGAPDPPPPGASTSGSPSPGRATSTCC
jgi:pyrroloquinoline-quinone synthase